MLDEDEFCCDFLAYVEGHRPAGVEPGSFVFPEDEPHDENESAATFYAAYGDGKPAIRLFENWRKLGASERTATLAHEFGHYLIWKKDGPQKYAEVDRLRARKVEDLTHDERRRIIDDETDAWSHAREILTSRGFNALSEFDICKENALETYRKKYLVQG